MKAPGGVIESVKPGSLGGAVGLQPGDQLLSINGQDLRDIIDVQFYGADEFLDLVVARGERQLLFEVERTYGDELGLTFANPTFDVDIRRCANNCDFCFVKQNARGMRRSLYIKDDDYRYSFLFGNFVTLTNLTDDDWARIEEQRLSPLYVSVHATDLVLRRRFLARKKAPDVMEQLHQLARLGVEVHTQVVLVPGLNDGAHFARTLDDLIQLRDAPVASVGVVPIGLTKHHPGQCRTYTPAESRLLLDQVDVVRRECREGNGTAFAYPSDEWYLVAGRGVPPAVAYDGFPQVENGVGMARQLLDEWSAIRAGVDGAALKPATLVCGTLIAPVLQRIVAELAERTGANLRLVPAVNHYFGPVTTVSGLLTGQDVVAALKNQNLGAMVLLPRAMFTGIYGAGSAPPDSTLDDMLLADIEQSLGLPVKMASSMADVLALLAHDPV